MLQLLNDTPFAAERAVQLDADGRHVWVVIVKATYRLDADGGVGLAAEQEPVCLVPQYFGEPGRSTCYRDCELVFDHPGTAISLFGHAWTPAGQPAQVLDVQAQIGAVSKTVRVFGDRYWLTQRGRLVPSPPQEFAALPLVYERAFGGVAPSDDSGGEAPSFDANPIGAGFATSPQRLANTPLPNFEYPESPTLDWDSRPAPAGFAMIPPNWMPRKSFAGTFDQLWERDRMPLWPEDFDSRFFLAAPADLVSDVPLRGGEPCVLRHLSQSGDLRFSLPRVHLSFSTETMSRQRIPHRAQLDRIYIEPDALKLVLVWRTVLNCGTDARCIRKTFIDSKRVVR